MRFATLPLGRVIGLGALTLALAVSQVHAQNEGLITETRDKYVPTIWVDPDGCEHWVMDDGWRGFMDIRLDRQGKPICNRGKACAEVPADQLFASGSATVAAEGRQRLIAFFQSGKAQGYAVSGHTDSDGSDAYNMRLSEERADAVARIAKSAGARVTSVAGYGERKPKASNASAAGKAANRRVEIFCVK